MGQRSDVRAQEFRKTFEPYGCELHAFNSSHFSQCLKGRRIIIVGDSTMRQTFQSLACLLHEEIKSGWFVVRLLLRSALPLPLLPLTAFNRRCSGPTAAAAWR